MNHFHKETQPEKVLFMTDSFKSIYYGLKKEKLSISMNKKKRNSSFKNVLSNQTSN